LQACFTGIAARHHFFACGVPVFNTGRSMPKGNHRNLNVGQG
jgi:hypothetical protein